MYPITVTPYQPRDRQALDDLCFRSHQVHTHLDWQDVHEWLDNRQNATMRLAWQDRRLVGALALSAPLNQTAWVRLAAIHDYAPAQEVLQALWDAMVEVLTQQEVKVVWVLVARPWLQGFIRPLGFHFDEDIITLQRGGQQIPTLPLGTSTPIREMFPTDIDRVLQVDHSAFTPPWQLARDELHQARRISAVATVAIQNDAIIGYQISTVYRDGAHLARLAVTPEVQGQGVGRALLADALRRFFRRGIYSMTVNTQATNGRSQRLYHQFSFERNGNDLPVWSLRL